MRARSPRRPAWAFLASLLSVLAFVLVGCGGNQVRALGATDVPELRPLLGEEVTVTAQVAALQSPRAFTIVSREAGTAEPVLVLHESVEPIEEDLPVIVTGTVRVLDISIGLPAGPDLERLRAYDGKPYIDAVRVIAPEAP